MKGRAVQKSRFPKARALCLYNCRVLYSGIAHLMKFNAKKPYLRKAIPFCLQPNYLQMKILIGLIVIFIGNNCLGQKMLPNQSGVSGQTDTSAHQVIYFEDFNDNKNNWTIADNKHLRSAIDNGFYYLTALGHAYGEVQEVKIDTRKDFQIETRIKILSGSPDHSHYYSMLFWGREAMNSYYFTFARDGFASVQRCSGKNQSSCTVIKGSLQKTELDPDDFNVYMIRKEGNTYSFFINGIQFYQMPFEPFFGNLIGIGAGRKVSLAIDYLKIVYL